MSPLALSLHFLQAQPDNRLITLARAGHEPAFEALVRRYRRELLAYCRRMQPASGNAEDALQQTFLQAWRALSDGAEVRDVRPWLYRIAHNVSLNHLRAPVAVPEELVDQAGPQEVHQLVEQRVRARAALAEMASLPALQRDVFVSTTLNGASHDEVASALGLSSGAVRGLIYRARATVRSAAAALIPSPAVHWAIRHAENRTGAAGVIGEALAGGGGAGVAAAIAKGGVLLTLAGAVGGVTFAPAPTHHQRHASRTAQSSKSVPSGSIAVRPAGVEPATIAAARAAVRAPDGAAARGFGGTDGRGRPGRSAEGEHGRASRSGREDRAGSGEASRDDGGSSSASSRDDGGGRSQGGTDGGSSSGSGADGGSSSGSGTDGGSASRSSGGSGGGSDREATTATASEGSSGSGSGGSGGSDGGSATDGGSGASGGATSDGGSGSDGGSTG